ncbi:toxic anion resistance protein [Parablautia intestinalis]|uniref:Toxic anion resistance protein n=1 Tax=Parablautia intestinalis TaxID=2320100 RepID=A0A3A9AVJ8_9FIRM|nr:toxic anion resistance protein [Parablautia intestinalis]RKI91543.1 toxic anion resistance protein [Parablautia intestinalis]
MSNNLDEMVQEAPSLTLTPFTVDEPENQPLSIEEEQPEIPEVVLTPQEQKMVDDFASQIDITNTQMVMQYGAGSQKKIADFSESALNNVRTKDMGEIGQMLTDVVTQLKDFDEPEEKGFLGIFKKGSNKLENMKVKYDKAENNINKICKVMESHQVTLLKDAAMLDKMYELNLNYFKELSMYILAGKQKLTQARTSELPALLNKAEQSGLPEDTQAANDYASMCERFEKKIYDLELTRTISMQMAPQIRLIQSNDTAMSEKIQSTLVNTIPLWKSQMVIAIGLNHSAEAARAQKEVTDMTNALLKKNAEALKTATIETARESERGIVDIETLTATNQTLISTLDEVLKIQEDGRTKRRNAEQELLRIENEMRKKLLSVSRSSSAQM